MTGRLRRFRVEKLIRDGLPEIMRAQGLAVFDRRLEDAAYIAALKDKLVEEAGEASASVSRDDLIEELADLAEVVTALSAAAGIAPGEIEAERLKKTRRARRLRRQGLQRRRPGAGRNACDRLLSGPRRAISRNHAAGRHR